MNEIKKYVNSYIVYFKNENDEPIEIWNEAGKMLIWDLNNLTFVNINWNAYNKFEIRKVEKRTQDYEIIQNQKKAELQAQDKLKRLEHFQKTGEIL